MGWQGRQGVSRLAQPPGRARREPQAACHRTGVGTLSGRFQLRGFPAESHAPSGYKERMPFRSIPCLCARHPPNRGYTARTNGYRNCSLHCKAHP